MFLLSHEDFQIEYHCTNNNFLHKCSLFKNFLHLSIQNGASIFRGGVIIGKQRNQVLDTLPLKLGHITGLFLNFSVNWRNWHNFSLTTSWSPKLILKADLKWDGPYVYSKFFLEHLDHHNFFLLEKWISHCIIKKLFGWGDIFCDEKKSEKAKHPGICPSFDGNVSKT